MKVSTLKLYGFRNYRQLDVSFASDVNIFIGRNAQGKTNILEALYFSAFGKSYRTTDEHDLILWQQPECAVQTKFIRRSVENGIRYCLSRSRRKQMFLNDEPARRRELGIFNVVLFSPEDLMIIKGNPAGRRKFLDHEIAQASPVYYHDLQQYNRVVLQRNNLLKKLREHRADSSLLDSWDRQLAGLAARIVMKRQATIQKLSMLSNLMHRRITNNSESLNIIYNMQGEGIDSENLIEWYTKQLAVNRTEDIFRGHTSVGPHRDDIIFRVNNVDLRSFGSQGQQRTGILAIKLAELEYIKSEIGEYPILLLDDVMSELDEERRHHLLLFIRDRIQTFITTTERILAEIKNASYYEIVDGSIRG